MTDNKTVIQRSYNMSMIRSKNTKPELIVRSLLHKMGYRFRLFGKISKKIYASGVLPGNPDIVLPKYHTVIFVHGCYWHHHENCQIAYVPKTRTEWWLNKFQKNKNRHEKVRIELEKIGWKIVIIWECEIRNNSLEDLRKLIENKLAIKNNYPTEKSK